MNTPGDIGPRIADEDAPESEPPQRFALEVVAKAGDWTAVEDLEARVAAIARVITTEPEIVARLPALAAACVAFSSDDDVRALNARYRGKDRPTNVLSFPAASPPPGALPDGEPVFLGDIVLAAETVAREARELAIPIADHVEHLVVHGVLHLIGHDHEADSEALIMETLETRLLAKLGVPDPYRSNE
jgi:probable rRNA maturation factor